jgi:DNA invertase Pin-like site-specific DNA recombinase
MGTKSLKTRAEGAQRVALYARVSTEEQTKGLYPSCDSQIEELQTL